MEFQATTPSLRKLCKITAPAAKRKDTHAWQSRVLLHAEAGAITAFGTDGSLETTTRISADVIQPGEYLLDHGRLSGIVDTIEAEEVRFQLRQDKLVVSCGRRRYQLPVYESDIYPKRLDLAGEIRCLTLPSEVLATLLQRAMGYANEDKTRPILGCIGLQVHSDHLCAVAASGEKAIYSEVGGDFLDQGSTEDFLLPMAAQRLVLGLCEQSREIRISWNASQIEASAGETTYRFPIPSGSYPTAVMSVLTAKGGSLVATFERTAMLGAITALRTATRSVDGVQWQLSPEGIQILAREADGSGMEITDEVDVEWKQDDHPGKTIKIPLDNLILALNSPGDKLGIYLRDNALWLESLEGDYEGLCITMLALMTTKA